MSADALEAMASSATMALRAILAPLRAARPAASSSRTSVGGVGCVGGATLTIHVPRAFALGRHQAPESSQTTPKAGARRDAV